MKRVLRDQVYAASNEIRGYPGNEPKKVDHVSVLHRLRADGVCSQDGWIESSRSIRKRSWLDMACLIPTARRVTSRRLDVTSATSTLAWQRHRHRCNFTRGCSHCIRTGSIQGRSGRLQELRNHPRTRFQRTVAIIKRTRPLSMAAARLRGKRGAQRAASDRPHAGGSEEVGLGSELTAGEDGVPTEIRRPNFNPTQTLCRKALVQDTKQRCSS